ncbi:fasciclin domain-containing protein [Eleftheria terrae]|uniref:fasciclin domain-containing protein n=1 Tax=Eleftheria terrae TaxID=1597781 RepID=UPI00263B7E30|nr:fasciclin domain-containing protein [Eleftheria terrae]WKB55950.1 fasciclin domain-containing protein [Eleftheria terrae]
MQAQMRHDAPSIQPELRSLSIGRADEKGTDLLSLIRCTPLLRVFAVLLQTTQLSETLGGRGPFTVFAPSNAAFGALPPHFLHESMRDMRVASTLLAHHIVPSCVRELDLGRGSLSALRGESICTRSDADGHWYGAGRLMDTGSAASNGVLWIINKVITPSTLSSRQSASEIRVRNPLLYGVPRN